ncbi:MAG TPA: diaminopimelate epimerase [Acidimicrobiia bacterium]|jgi:diaminopimelate epimerase|nr:diaminopimelate epimerase [Acidimicrobiia bacterium]
MQGLGNDFIVIEGPATLTPEEIDALCDRRFGIGADGVLVVTRGEPITMEYWNADGSAAEMCGNGLRCVARFAYDRGWAPGPDFQVDTPVGLRGVRVHDGLVEAELGPAVLDGRREIDGREYQVVDVGNPHAVTFVDDPSEVDVVGIGTAAQGEFASGSNVEFATLTDDGITMRVWERGVGETLACGTGMAAVAAVANRMFEVESPVAVTVPGGQASIDLRDGVAWIIGPAEYSFRGSVEAR